MTAITETEPKLLPIITTVVEELTMIYCKILTLLFFLVVIKKAEGKETEGIK